MGKTFKHAIEIIERKRERALTGKVNAIPFNYPRLSQYIPGVQQSNYTIVTANTGIGKSKFAKKAFILDPYRYVKAHPEADIKFKVFAFCLEEGKDKFIHSIISEKLYADHGVRVSVKQLRSMFTDQIIGDTVMQMVKDMQPWLEEFEDHVEVIEDVRHPYGIYLEVEKWLLANGTRAKKKIKYGDGFREVPGKYTSRYENPYVIVYIDHIGLVQPEKSDTLHEAMRKASAYHMVNLRNIYGCSPVVVQQQSAQKEQQEYYRGKSIESKLEPSLDALGDNKLTGRDADEVIGLFAPDRYEIEKHRGYDIVLLQDNYRSLSILKSRDGEANIRVGMFFDGACDQFAELPKASEMTREDYQLFLSIVGRNAGEQRTINFSAYGT